MIGSWRNVLAILTWRAVASRAQLMQAGSNWQTRAPQQRANRNLPMRDAKMLDDAVVNPAAMFEIGDVGWSGPSGIICGGGC